MKMNKLSALRNFFKTKWSLERKLLLVILLLVAMPYIPRANQVLLKWKDNYIWTQEVKERQKEENLAKDLQDKLLSKYEIKTLEFDYGRSSKDDILTYKIPEKVFDYLRRKESCEQMLSVEQSPKRVSRYDKFIPSSLNPEQVCKKTENLKPSFDNFVLDLPKIRQLISDNIASNDKVILALVKKLQEGLTSYGNIAPSLSDEEVIEVIKNRLEVKDFLQTMESSNQKVVFLIRNRTEDTATVQVAEDHPTHLATFNWYTLDTRTGLVKCSFNKYEGDKYVGNNENYPCE